MTPFEAHVLRLFLQGHDTAALVAAMATAAEGGMSALRAHSSTGSEHGNSTPVVAGSNPAALAILPNTLPVRSFCHQPGGGHGPKRASVNAAGRAGARKRESFTAAISAIPGNYPFALPGSSRPGAARAAVPVVRARERVAARLGIPKGALEGLRRERAKGVKAWVFERLRSAIIAEAQREITRCQHELEIARQAGLDPRSDEMAALVRAVGTAQEMIQTPHH